MMRAGEPSWAPARLSKANVTMPFRGLLRPGRLATVSASAMPRAPSDVAATRRAKVFIEGALRTRKWQDPHSSPHFGGGEHSAELGCGSEGFGELCREWC